MSLLEGIAGVAILALAAVAAAGAMLAGSHAAAAPAPRDRALLAARNAAVEARAASSYDDAAAAAILSAPPSSWSVEGVALRSSVAGTALLISAADGSAQATVTYRAAREAIPQGAILDGQGDFLAP